MTTSRTLQHTLLLILLAVGILSVPTPSYAIPRCDESDWNTCYQVMLSKIQDMDYSSALFLADKLIARDPLDRQERYIRAVLASEYWPHYYRAKALMGLERFEEAQVELMHTTYWRAAALGRDLSIQISTSWKAPQGPQDGIYAVIVGVNNYDVNRSFKPLEPTDEDVGRSDYYEYAFRNLDGAIADAEAIARYLVRDAGVPSYNIRLLTGPSKSNDLDGLGILADAEPTLGNVNAAITWMADKQSKQCIFVFVGHGIGSRQFGNLLLVQDTQPWGFDLSADGESAIEKTSIKLSRVDALLYNSHSETPVIVLDACRDNPTGKTKHARGARSKAILPPEPLTPDWRDVNLENQIGTPRPGIPPIIYYATSFAHESQELRGHGLFMPSFIEGLGRALPIANLADFLRDDLSEITHGQQVPSFQRSENCPMAPLNRIRIAPPISSRRPTK